MVIYNASSKELTAKIVYYGPGLSGKTTNLQFLHNRLEPSSVGNLLTLAATADRTIYFDLLPVELGDIKGYKIRFQVATVPGQTPYNETRRTVLRGADGIVFVVDSRWSMLPKNLESLQNLKENLKEEGMSFEGVPLVIQYNKRDLPDVLAIDALQEALGLSTIAFTEAVATDGRGVVETFKLVSKLTFVDILRRLQRKEVSTTAGKPDIASLATWKNAMVVSPPPESAQKGAPGTAPPGKPSRESAAAAPPEAPFEPPPFEEPLLDVAQDNDVAEPIPFPEPVQVREKTNPTLVPDMPGPAPTPNAAKSGQHKISEDTAPLRAGVPPSEPPPPRQQIDDLMQKLAPRRDSRTLRPSQESPVPESPRLAGLETALAALQERAGQLERHVSGIEAKSAESAHQTASALVEKHARQMEERISELDRKHAAEPEKLLAQFADVQKKASEERKQIEALVSKETTALARRLDETRSDWAAGRIASENTLRELRGAVDNLQKDLAEASGREMEVVAQVNRESLSRQAYAEKVNFRIADVEGRFSEVAVTQESRISRTEKLIEEQAGRSGEEREAIRRLAGELSQRIDETQDAIRRWREENERRISEVETVREQLAAALSDLAERLRRSLQATTPS